MHFEAQSQFELKWVFFMWIKHFIKIIFNEEFGGKARIRFTEIGISTVLE